MFGAPTKMETVVHELASRMSKLWHCHSAAWRGREEVIPQPRHPATLRYQGRSRRPHPSGTLYLAIPRSIHRTSFCASNPAPPKMVSWRGSVDRRGTREAGKSRGWPQPGSRMLPWGSPCDTRVWSCCLLVLWVPLLPSRARRRDILADRKRSCCPNPLAALALQPQWACCTHRKYWRR